MNEKRQIPEWQQAIINKCYHPTGVWEEFPESEYETSIPARFEKIVARFPDHVAVVDDQRSLTYAELNAEADRVAHALLAMLGSDPEPVVHFFPQGVDGIVAILGILKAGKFFVPLDVHLPTQRLQNIITDLGSRLALTSCEKVAALDFSHGMYTCHALVEQVGYLSDNTSLPVPTPDSYSYIIYTSGSTGTPKGVIVNHRNVLHFASLFINNYHLSHADRAIQSTSFSFSGFYLTMFGALLGGATLVLYDFREKGAASLPAWIAHTQITLITLPSSMYRVVFGMVTDSRQLASVRLVLLGGERVLPADLALFRQLFPKSCLFRLGIGSSEMKVFSDIILDHDFLVFDANMPLGFAQSGVEISIVDESGHRLGANKVGEIVVRSRFVSPGYWRDPELTRRKFRIDPEQPDISQYYSGDNGWLDSSGCLYFAGRLDSQVKIRGQRVELGEVESALLSLDNVGNAVVALRGDSVTEQRLLAWLVWEDPSQRLTTSQLRRLLAERLPDYMIPGHFLSLPQFPLNANGKIDHNSLPMPEPSRPHLDNPVVAPQTPLESRVAQVWSEILGIEGIGIYDNFFELGGNSIQAMQIITRLQPLSAAAIHIQVIFDAPTVAQMAMYLTVNYLEEMQEDSIATGNQPATVVPKESDEAPAALVSATDIEYFHVLCSQPIVGQNIRSEPSAQNSPAIFVLAPSRSGTTLLRVLLAGHPGLFAPPELYLLNHTDLSQRKEANQGRASFRQEGTVRALKALHGCTTDQALEMMTNYEAQGQTSQEFYAVLQSAAGERLLVDKTPFYASHSAILGRAEKWFDQPFYIHLSRHPYGMIDSYISNRFHLRSELRHFFSAHQLAELTWLTYHQNILDYLAKIPGERQFHIRYEDLVNDPTLAMEQLCAFLKIEFHPAMLEPYADTENRMTDGLYPDSLMIGDPNFRHFSAVAVERSESWRTRIESDFLCPESREIARRLGYSEFR